MSTHKVFIQDRADLAQALPKIHEHIGRQLQAGPLVVSIANPKERGSLEQNALFHQLCTHAAAMWSLLKDKHVTMEDVKYEVKHLYGPIGTRYDFGTGTRVAELLSWGRYTKRQRSDLITATLVWMAENDIPDLPTDAYDEYREAAA